MADSDDNQRDDIADVGAGFVERLANSFLNHPGFMWTQSGFEVLHADWPAYPRGHGLSVVLETLGEFPPETQFYAIDNIDCCTLFVVARKPERDPYDKRYLHVALWDDDLREAARRGHIAELQHDEGSLHFPSGYIAVTSSGTDAILVHELTMGMPQVLLERVQEHLEARRYDTAVREAAPLLELRMRAAVQSEAFGQALVDECFGARGRLQPKGLPKADRLHLHALFRTFFRFVRNEYAHRIPPVDLVTACRLLRRCGRLFKAVEALERGPLSGGV